MKYLADTEALVRDRILTEEQADEIARRSREGMIALVINIVLFFGILAVIGGAAALLEDMRLVTGLGAVVAAAGAVALYRGTDDYRLLSNAAAVIGSCMFVGGAVIWIVEQTDSVNLATGLGLLIGLAGYLAFRRGNERLRFLAGWMTFLGVAAHLAGLLDASQQWAPSWLVFHYAGFVLVLCGVALDVRIITAMSMLAFATALSSETFYGQGMYGVAIYESTLTIVQMAILAGLGLWVYETRPDRWARHAGLLARLAFVWMNIAFWIGSLWGDVVGLSLWGPNRVDFASGSYQDAVDAFMAGATSISEDAFALVWAVLIVAAGLWAARGARRAVFNTAVTFGSIHLYTQYFERLSATPGTVLVAGLLAIAIAYATWRLNAGLTARTA